MIDDDHYDEAEWLLDQAERAVLGALADDGWDDPDLSDDA